MPLIYKKEESTLAKLDEEQEDEDFNKIFAIKTKANKNQYERVKQDLEDDDDEDSSCFKKAVVGFKGYLFAILAALFFTLSNIFIRMGSSLAGSDHLAVLFIITLFLMIIIICYNRDHMLGPQGQRLLLSVRGIIGVCALVFLYFALLFIPPSDLSAIANSSIIITAIFARIFLKEKIGISHLFALLFTIIGVLFIVKPEFIFKHFSIFSVGQEIKNQTLINTTSNSTLANTTAVSEETKFLVGIILVILAALLFGLLQVLVKKLCNYEVHWAVNTIYPAYFGIPVCICISAFLYFMGFSHKNLKEELPILPYHVLYSSISAVFGILGQVSMNISLSCEDATKVSIVKTTDVLIAFVLQLIILNIRVDLLSIVGSVLILTGTSIVLLFKMIEDKYSKSNKKSCFKSCLMIKF